MASTADKPKKKKARKKKAPTTPPCERCQLDQRSGCATKYLRTYSPANPRVLVMLPPPTAPAAYNYWREPNAIYGDENVTEITNTLVSLGWSWESIYATFAFSYTLRCVPTAADDTKSRRKICGELALNDLEAMNPEALIVFGADGWDTLNVPAKGARRSRGRAVMHELRNGHEIAVFTMSKPTDVRDYPMAKNLTQAYFKRDLERVGWFLEGTFDPEADVLADLNVTVPETAEHAIAIFNFYRDQPAFAWDVETAPADGSVDPYNDNHKLLGISLSCAKGYCAFIPLFHVDSPLGEEPGVLAAMAECMEGQAWKIAHNGVSFDATSLANEKNIQRVLGRPIITVVNHDTMLADGLIDENRIHSLKTLATYELRGRERYDDELDNVFESLGVSQKERDYELHVPFPTLCRYGGADSEVTWRLAEVQVEKLHAMPSRLPWADMYDFFIGHQMVDGNSAAEMSANGMFPDTTHHEKLRAKVEAEYNDVRAQCLNHPVVKAYEAQRASKMLAEDRWYTDGEHIFSTRRDQEAGAQPAYHIDTGREVLPGIRDVLIAKRVIYKNGKVIASRTYTLDDVKPNLGSTKQLAEICTTILGLKSTRQTDTGKDSYDAEAIKHLVQFDKTGWLELFTGWRRLNKVVGTYIRPVVQGPYTYVTESGKEERKRGWIRDDGYVHPIVMVCGSDFGQGSEAEDKGGGTVSGRHSVREPNSTNLEKHTEWGKALYNIFVSRHRQPGKRFCVDRVAEKMLRATGKMLPEEIAVFPDEPGSGFVLQVDFSQVELRIFAMVTGCQWMLDRYRAGADLHAELAMEIFRVSRDEVFANDGFLRFCAKSVWFGPIYGETARGLMADLRGKGVMSFKNPNEPITLAECEEFLERTYARMPEYESYKAMLAAQLDESASFLQLTGRRRFIPQWRSRDRYTRSKAVRQAVNSSIQGPAGDCTNFAVYVAQRELKARGMRTLVVNSVHDSIVLDGPSEEFTAAYRLVKHIMENLQPWHGLRRQDLLIPLIAEGEAGESWGDLIAVDDEKSTETQTVFNTGKLAKKLEEMEKVA